VYQTLWRKQARINTDIFDEIFPEKPQDSIVDWGKRESRRVSVLENVSVDSLNEVVGHQILFPLRYLEEAQDKLRHSLTDSTFQ
jgi:hypothetical protein